MFRMRHDLKKVHFHALCEEVKKQCTFELINIQGGAQLADQIFERTGKRLSASTLYRILISEQNKHVPYLSTLDILSDYVGHHDWITFCKFNEAVPEISTDKKIIPDEMGLQLLKICLDNHHFQSVIDYLKMLEGPVLPSWDMHMKLGSILGLALRKDKIAQRDLLPELARIPEGRFFFFESFVDEDYLNGYYGQALENYQRYQFDLIDNQPFKDHLFSQCLLFYRAYKKQDFSTLMKIGDDLFSIDEERISIHQVLSSHPVGRWHAYRLAYWYGQKQLHSARLKASILRLEQELDSPLVYQRIVILQYTMEILLSIGEYNWIIYLYERHVQHLQFSDKQVELELILAYTKIAYLEKGYIDLAFNIPLLDANATYIENKTLSILNSLKEKESQYL